MLNLPAASFADVAAGESATPPSSLIPSANHSGPASEPHVGQSRKIAFFSRLQKKKLPPSKQGSHREKKYRQPSDGEDALWQPVSRNSPASSAVGHKLTARSGHRSHRNLKAEQASCGRGLEKQAVRRSTYVSKSPSIYVDMAVLLPMLMLLIKRDT